MSIKDVMKTTDVKKILSNVMEKTNSVTKTAIKTPHYASIYLLRFSFITILLYYILLKLNILGSAEILGSGISTILMQLYTTSKVLWLIETKFYISIVSGYVLLMIYIDLLIFLPWYSIFSTKDFSEKIERILKWQFGLLLILILPLMLNYAGLFATNSDTQSSDVNQFQENQKSTWEQLKDGPLCYIFNSPTQCNKIENSIKTDNSGKEIFSTILKDLPNPFFRISELKKNGIPITYEFQTGKSEGIFVKELKCYQNKVEDKNLLDTQEINRQILSENGITETFNCKIDKLKQTKSEEEIKIISVLTLSLLTKYEIEIPLYNYDEFIKNYPQNEAQNFYTIQEKARQEYGKGKIGPSNNALNHKVLSDSFPIPISKTEEFPKDIYRLEITISEKDFTTFGKLIDSNVIKISPPKLLQLETKKEDILTSYKEKSSIRLVFKTENIELNEPYTNDNSRIELNTNFEKTSKFNIIVSDLYFIEEINSTDKTIKNNNEIQKDLLNKLGVPTNGIYEYGADLTASNLFYKYNYNNNIWMWSSDKDIWMEVYTEKVSDSSSKYANEKPSDGNLEFIKKLRDNNPIPN